MILRHVQLLVCSVFCFILGCTLTIIVSKYDDCSDKDIHTVASRAKLPRESSFNFLFKENLNSRPKNAHKVISAYLVILIMSSPDNIEQRNSIRESWGSYLHKDVQHYFFVGSKNLSDKQSILLVKEYENNKDLVLLAETADSYQELTSKVLMSFTWVARSVEFSFVLKCDDDTYVRVPRLVEELKKIENFELGKPPRHFYWGFFDGRAHFRRTGKWAEPNWVLCDRYLPYALGGGYVLSMELVKILADRAPLLEIFRNEDVAVGAWLSSVKGLTRKHDPRFDTEYASRGCSEDYLITHKVSVKSMREHFASIRDHGKLCPSGEFKRRNSYVYNWNVLPSQCCIRNDTTVP